MQFAAERFSGLRVLELPTSPYLTDDAIAHVVRSCPRLKALIVKDMSKIEGKNWLPSTTDEPNAEAGDTYQRLHPSRLKHLDVSGTKSEEVISSLGQGHWLRRRVPADTLPGMWEHLGTPHRLREIECDGRLKGQ